MRLAIIRQRYAPAAGAERFFEGALEALLERNVAISLYTRSWPQTKLQLIEPVICDPWYAGSFLREWGFARSACRAISRSKANLVESHERLLCCDIYRARDGVHAVWLEERLKGASALESASSQGIALQPLHEQGRAAPVRESLAAGGDLQLENGARRNHRSLRVAAVEAARRLQRRRQRCLPSGAARRPRRGAAAPPDRRSGDRLPAGRFGIRAQRCGRRDRGTGRIAAAGAPHDRRARSPRGALSRARAVLRRRRAGDDRRPRHRSARMVRSRRRVRPADPLRSRAGIHAGGDGLRASCGHQHEIRRRGARACQRRRPRLSRGRHCRPRGADANAARRKHAPALGRQRAPCRAAAHPGGDHAAARAVVPRPPRRHRAGEGGARKPRPAAARRRAVDDPQRRNRASSVRAAARRIIPAAAIRSARQCAGGCAIPRRSPTLPSLPPSPTSRRRPRPPTRRKNRRLADSQR